jgi:anthranilate synthase component 1
MLTEADGQVAWIGNRPVGLPDEGLAVDALRDSLASLRTPRPEGLPPLTGGLVGFVAYDAVRRWEPQLPDDNPDDLGLPEVAMLMATDLAVVDHIDGSIWLVANAINYDDTDARVDAAYEDAVARLDVMQADLHVRSGAVVSAVGDYPPRTPTVNQRYRDAVESAKEYIRAGDAFQIVLSQRFVEPCAAPALDVYRALRMTNPSPYMYLLNLPGADMDSAGFSIVGSSPEALVKLTGDEAMLHPIAGTRPRGRTPDEDADLVAELLADPKERAEHLMLVDLGRNDLGRVCRAGTVNVVEFMRVEQYSHVHHIVSTVVGRLRGGVSAYDLLAATFPAGTLSGAPKPRAMEIIDELEQTRRGLYAGCIGYFDFAGDMDTAIAIRTALIRDGQAYVQAGAGIVADSVAQTEDLECQSKAAAVLRALAIAEDMS